MKLKTISKSEAARYMGIRGEPDAAIQAILDEAEELVREKLRPSYVYRETALEFTEDGVKADCMSIPMPGEDIKRHLEGCGKAILIAATVSAEADKLIRQAAVTNMARSLAIDCLCSAAVEQVCETAEEEIFSRINAPYRTWRFSPGYGDLPISMQREFILALNAQRRIGLTVTESSLLVPSKSVTAIIGISELPIEQKNKGCDMCRLKENCSFRLSGRRCGDK